MGKKKKVSIPDLIAKAVKRFNKYIRERDKGKPCISCGSDKFDHAGHYYAGNAAPSIRLDEDNVHGQCAGCNLFKHGNLIGYRKGLVERYGEDFVRVLDIKFDAYKRDGWKWEREYLENIINKYEDYK
jgi:hypothetical protein